MSGESTRGGSPFSRATVFAVVVAGFLAFLAMLYFLSAGDTGGQEGRGAAHASSRGLNGYAALVRLLEANDIDIVQSRERSGLETDDLLVLTPGLYADPEEIGEILESRKWLGPTLVIVPKWMATPPPPNVEEEVKEKFKDDWVQLDTPIGPYWTDQLPRPYDFEHDGQTLAKRDRPRWSGLGQSGTLPTSSVAYTEEGETREPILVDGDGRILAFSSVDPQAAITSDEDYSDDAYYDGDYYDEAYWTVFVVEPDLVNNYGLSDPDRAALALALIEDAGYAGQERVVFDLTMNGYGGAENLLTLAFRPPFLAATLCLILAMLIVGWRAFMRFGPAASRAPEIAFGKKRLVSNGAGLIVRAKRLRLLAAPYAALSERRLAKRLGLQGHDPERIDEAIAARLPDEEPFTSRARKLRDARSPTEILRAARALRELEGKLAS